MSVKSACTGALITATAIASSLLLLLATGGCEYSSPDSGYWGDGSGGGGGDGGGEYTSNGQDAVPFSSLNWTVNHPSKSIAGDLPISATLSGLSAGGGKVSYSLDSRISGADYKTDPTGAVPMMVALFFNRNGSWQGGGFDWSSAGPGSFSKGNGTWHNIAPEGNPNFGFTPESGDKFVMLVYGKDSRSNIAMGTVQ